MDFIEIWTERLSRQLVVKKMFFFNSLIMNFYQISTGCIKSNQVRDQPEVSMSNTLENPWKPLDIYRIHDNLC